MSDTKKTLICPACGETMTKIYTNMGLNVDICLNGCGGIWFDNRETENFSQNDDNYDEINSFFEKNNFKKVDTNKLRVCPVCKTKMVQNKANCKDEVIIDICYSCGGKFLDYGELEKIKNSNIDNSEKAQTLTKSLYHKNEKPLHKAKNDAVKDFLRNLYENNLK